MYSHKILLKYRRCLFSANFGNGETRLERKVNSHRCSGKYIDCTKGAILHLILIYSSFMKYVSLSVLKMCPYRDHTWL